MKNFDYKIRILICLVAFIGVLVNGCDNKIGKPDVRNEFNQDKKFDYFGWKWHWKW